MKAAPKWWPRLPGLVTEAERIAAVKRTMERELREQGMSKAQACAVVSRRFGGSRRAAGQ